MPATGISAHAHSISPGFSGEVDIELLTFVERYATNLARWDVLLFFGRNPATCDDACGIARRIGRRPQSLVKELDDLAFLGVLRSRANGDGTMYRLTRVPATRRAVVRLAQHFSRPRSPKV